MNTVILLMFLFAIFGVLRFHLIAETRVHQRDAMLKRSLQLGNCSQQMNFAGRAPILETYAPFHPVLANIVEFLGLTL